MTVNDMYMMDEDNQNTGTTLDQEWQYLLAEGKRIGLQGTILSEEEVAELIIARRHASGHWFASKQTDY